MTSDTKTGNRGQLLHRVQSVAIGFAETGLTHAEEILRRVSPEGRAQAQREREARARRRKKLFARLIVAWLASLTVLVLLAQFVALSIAMLATMVVMATAVAFIVSRAAPRSPGREALVGAKLAALPGEVNIWLAAQRRGLPSPAVALVDKLSCRLDDLAPQLARLEQGEPATGAVRKLISVELPGLVEGWRSVPPSLRDVVHADGSTPNGQLIDGLELINGEIERTTEQLARGALDEIATHGRYLELKYRDGDLQAD